MRVFLSDTAAGVLGAAVGLALALGIYRALEPRAFDSGYNVDGGGPILFLIVISGLLFGASLGLFTRLLVIWAARSGSHADAVLAPEQPPLDVIGPPSD